MCARVFSVCECLGEGASTQGEPHACDRVHRHTPRRQPLETDVNQPVGDGS